MAQLRILFIGTLAAAWLVGCGGAYADPASDDSLADELTSELVCLPSCDIRPLKDTLQKFFDNADRSRLMNLADHPNFNVAMCARWELRRTLFSHTFDPKNRFYPTRFLELKGIEVPPAWAGEFVDQYFPTDLVETENSLGLRYLARQRRDPRIKELYRQAVEYYRAHIATSSTMSFIDMDPRTYVHCDKADIPAGTTVHESASHLLVKQADMTVRLEKPLTKNLCGMIALGWGDPGCGVFLPLITKEKTFVLNVRGCQIMPFELTCFRTQSGAQIWETIGWSAMPQKVEVWPRNALSAGLDATLLRTLVGEIKPPQSNDYSPRASKDQFTAACCSWYLTANDELATVFGFVRGLLFVEAFDVKTGRNVLRFATDYHAEQAEADQTQIREGKVRKAKSETKKRG